MRMIVQRVVVPAAAVVAGIAALVYGMNYHAAPVAQQELEEREQEEQVTKTIRVPVPFAGRQEGGPGLFPWGKRHGPSASAQADEGEAPPGMSFITEKVKVRELVKRQVPVMRVVSVLEPDIIREITVGGVLREEGQLRRTYTAGEPPPSLCPS
jgi:hypothetical protein